MITFPSLATDFNCYIKEMVEAVCYGCAGSKPDTIGGIGAYSWLFPAWRWRANGGAPSNARLSTSYAALNPRQFGDQDG